MAVDLGGESVTAGGGHFNRRLRCLFLNLKSPTDLSSVMLTGVLFRLLFGVASPDHGFSDAKSGFILENEGGIF